MKLSKQNYLTKLAYQKGYRVNEEGTEVFNKKGRALKLSRQNKGGKIYLSFNIRPKGENSTRVYVHKLQAYQKFKDKVFLPEIVVRHYDDNSQNNSFTNLMIGTQAENMQDKIRNRG